MKPSKPLCRRNWLGIVTSQFALILLGCGTEHGTIPVSGFVRVKGAPPPGEGKVIFTPVEAAGGFTQRAGFARFGSDGRYAAQSFKPGDGLFPGRYLVAVECWETPPNMEGKPVKSHIDPKYTDPHKSGLELVVEPDAGSVDFDIGVP
jgi:hypothetical protein